MGRRKSNYIFVPDKKARGGMGGVYVRTIGKSGKVTLTLSAEGCQPITIVFNITSQSGKEDRDG